MTNQNVEFVWTIMLQVRMREALVRVVFGIVKNLADPVLLGTSFIHKFVEGTFPAKRKIVSYNPQSLPKLMVYEASDDSRAITRNTNETDCHILAVERKGQDKSCT